MSNVAIPRVAQNEFLERDYNYSLFTPQKEPISEVASAVHSLLSVNLTITVFAARTSEIMFQWIKLCWQEFLMRFKWLFFGSYYFLQSQKKGRDYLKKQTIIWRVLTCSVQCSTKLKIVSVQLISLEYVWQMEFQFYLRGLEFDW